MEDLISIGTIGLIKSINTYKPDRNIKLVSNRNSLIPFVRCEQEYTICYRDIKQIGPDVIIDDLC